MILVVYCAVAGLLLAWATGGDLRVWVETHLRMEWLLVGALALQVLLPRFLGGFLQSDTTMVWVFWVPTAVLLMVALIANMKNDSWGFGIAALGILLNLLVVGLNGGMPVLVSAGGSVGFDTALMQSQLDSSWLHVDVMNSTRLLFLADVVPLPGPAIARGMASLGDVLLSVGIGHAVFQMSHSRKRSEST